ncbi:pyruvate, water dikinase [Natronobacterium gregoryi]|uniref:Phosphoenolpyruvate synthase n=2 Tax=Natronobacterium gregoryi TaxID=44930 RepID=L0AJG5_NATGS|nr:pyruvate, water dikinase [Natronobacterium gregoryi]AFZ74038.1 phosphoenolpyruvate synthase [Natronobacterium gregoryi SP2]ELY70539.1 phosphoenolpyruvate synthase [Natronobacterium gregoryi SP2]PLK20785.1 pyruvate, water dikinase [Natronobacterium gregoryi SP2]SFJ07073.1 phosphoenolpyruvate synthase [Natronobacterium gregoryi]
MSRDSFVRSLEALSGDDTDAVGGKSANLGELADLDVPVLPGFTTTASAYDYYVEETGIHAEIESQLEGLDVDDVADLQRRGERIRHTISEASMPPALESAIRERYAELGDELGIDDPEVAVRSSATAEDLPEASFAGQQETFLNVTGETELLESIKHCFASLFTDRAIVYRENNDFDHFDVKLACAVQKMGRADLASSGVLFTLDPDTGFDEVVTIEAAYGFGEPIVQGVVDPDRYVVFKPTTGIVEKECGGKSQQMVRRNGGTKLESVPDEKREQFALSDDRIRELARYATRIEDHFGTPQDIEWLVDGDLEELFVVQTRPETVHGAAEGNVLRTYSLEAEETDEPLLAGVAIGNAIGSGTVRVLSDHREMDRVEEGDVLVTEMTDPDWVPVMKRASAIVTDRGGKTSHAAIVSRELGIPAIVRTGAATESLSNGDHVTVDCSADTGRVYEGELEYDVTEEVVDDLPETDTDVTLILGDPGRAFALANLPVDGVGLAREEFIVTSHVGSHPLELLERGEEKQFVDALRTGIAKIGAAFYPDEVIFRLSDFKTDEYRNLEGGWKYEPDEANPMLGWRGASRYYDEAFREAFRLECEALRQVREEVGLDNVIVMVPFCRTPEEGERVLEIMAEYGLSSDEMDVYVMAELPANIVLADRFADLFDGFSIGSNDLTQLMLGVDRNSEKLAPLFDETDDSVTRSISSLIEEAHRHDRPVGICGDAPSTIPEYTEFLLEEGIDSISVSPDVAVETILTVAEFESAE